MRKKRNIRLLGARTSVVLEQAFWDAINVILLRENMALHDFRQLVQERRCSTSLTASLHLVTLLYFQTMAEMWAMATEQPAPRNQIHAPKPDGFGVLPIALTRFREGEMRAETRPQGR
ncbi:MAG: ribbon-helix-helix domain-containing protein [Candidatus Puniceispirillum sp.]